MDPNSAFELRAALSKVPFRSRWELLKPTIKRLYIDEGRRLIDVIDIIKRDYAFDALYVSTCLIYLHATRGAFLTCGRPARMTTNTTSTRNGS